MYTKIKVLTLAAGMYFLTGCNDSTTTDNATSDSTTTSKTEGDSTGKMMSSDDMKKSDKADLMSAMNQSMEKMHSMQMTGDFDADWANMMVAHHQGAIDMAQVELSQGTDEKMKAKAQEIITKQTEEQNKLKNLVKSSKPSDMKMGEGELEKSMSAMMSKMQSMKMSGNVDKDFATMMIEHHQDGISMSKKEVANGMNKEIKQMAQKGITDQQKDISEFKNWLTTNK